MRFFARPRCERVLPAMAIVLLLGCASSGERIFVAPSDATVIASVAPASRGRAREVFVQNNSTVTVTVTSIELRACQNVRNLCSATLLNVVIAPGRRERILVVEPQNPEQAPSFGFQWRWEASARVPIP